VRMEEEEAAYDVSLGQSVCRSFGPGAKFSIEDHPSAGENGKPYVVTKIRHEGHIDDTYIGGASAAEELYRNSFACIPAATVFRPPRVTPRPTVQGVQTALVVGPKGEEIYTDKYGRVKVQFFW